MEYQYQIIEECIITNFQSLVKSIPHVLEAYRVKHQTVYKAIGMSRSTWERRIENNNFTATEMLQIAKFLNPIFDPSRKKVAKKGKR